jgi:hypothetical protein
MPKALKPAPEQARLRRLCGYDDLTIAAPVPTVIPDRSRTVQLRGCDTGTSQENVTQQRSGERGVHARTCFRMS